MKQADFPTFCQAHANRIVDRKGQSNQKVFGKKLEEKIARNRHSDFHESLVDLQKKISY